jgi:predicted DNA-binding transcriptional regulator YafY
MIPTTRQQRILALIPKRGRIAVTDLHAKLMAEGFDLHVKTVRRELEALSRGYPIVCDERSKPHGWAWAPGAEAPLPPALDAQTALAFRLLAEHGSRMLPPLTIDALREHFEHAARVLDEGPSEALRRWPRKLRVLAPSLPLVAPEIEHAVHDVVYRAVFEERQFRATYVALKGSTRVHVVNPLALVLRGGVTHVICTIRKPSEPTLLALHRIRSAELLSGAASTSAFAASLPPSPTGSHGTCASSITAGRHPLTTRAERPRVKRCSSS